MYGYSERNCPADEVLDALGRPIRRHLLFKLYEQSRDAEHPVLEYDALPRLQGRDAQIRLHHVALPKLEAYGFVEYRESPAVLRPGPQWSQIRPLLAILHEHLSELPPELRGTCGHAPC